MESRKIEYYRVTLNEEEVIQMVVDYLSYKGIPCKDVVIEKIEVSDITNPMSMTLKAYK